MKPGNLLVVSKVPKALSFGFGRNERWEEWGESVLRHQVPLLSPRREAPRQ